MVRAPKRQKNGMDIHNKIGVMHATPNLVSCRIALRAEDKGPRQPDALTGLNATFLLQLSRPDENAEDGKPVVSYTLTRVC